MKHLNHISILKTTVIAAALLCIGALAMAVQNKKAVPKPASAVGRGADAGTYDTRLLKKLDVLAAKINGSKQGTYKGFITIRNPLDTVTNITNMPFTFSRSNNDSYYKVGGAEVLNAGGVNVFVDPDSKRVMLTAQKKLYAPISIDVKQFADKLKDGEYKLIAKNRGKIKTLTMLNELNFDCKEYSISYDTVRMQVTRVFSRTADVNDPFNSKKERVIDIRINGTKNVAAIDRTVAAGRVVYRKGGQWKLSSKYSTYQLIKL